jgi:hypothetical protein
MNANDFLISLGFDTKKLNKQIEDIQKKFEKIAVGVGVKSPAVARAKRKELSEAEKLEKTKARIRNQLAERERVKKVNAELGIVKEVAKAKVKEAKKVVQAEANAHIVAYQKAQARLARKVTPTRTPAPPKPMYNGSGLAQQAVGAARGRGVDSGIANAFGSRIAGAANVQQAKQYANILAMISTRLNALDSFKRAELLRIVDSGDIARLVHFNKQLGQTSNEMRRMERRSISLATVQRGLGDSTRNLVREYASLYAIFMGVGAIKEQAKAMDGVEAGMTAVSKSAEEVAHNIQFIKDEALKNGLAVGEAAKSYTKLKAAIGDKATLQETEQMFQALTKAGVVFQLSQDNMTGTIKAVSDMFAKEKIQAEELRGQLNLAA